jgi:hypothetical protein
MFTPLSLSGCVCADLNETSKVLETDKAGTLFAEKFSAYLP